ncbi:MAG TPA: hypothetical protein VHZ56_10580 [Devosia sp.]|jgi:hypothetical protein|nr:hypothetical protein [Devosia sp.]
MTNFVRRVRAWVTPHHLAQLGILALLLAGLRTIGEYFRLQWNGGVLPAVVGPLLLGAMLAVAGAFLGLILYFFGRDRLALGLSVIGIGALVVYRLLALPGLG